MLFIESVSKMFFLILVSVLLLVIRFWLNSLILNLRYNTDYWPIMGFLSEPSQRDHGYKCLTTYRFSDDVLNSILLKRLSFVSVFFLNLGTLTLVFYILCFLINESHQYF